MCTDSKLVVHESPFYFFVSILIVHILKMFVKVVLFLYNQLPNSVYSINLK